MGDTSIEWTDKTWNPTRGCSRVSPGCDNCYAMRQAHRHSGPGRPYEGLTTLRKGKVDWSGTARFIPGQLSAPLRWRKPCRVFVNSMSDLFHHSLTNEEIAAVFGVMAACPQHTFQVLTKRPERALEWFRWFQERGPWRKTLCELTASALVTADWHCYGIVDQQTWPLPNVWLLVSCENQEQLAKRVPILLKCPAAIRGVSAEPLLGPLDLSAWTWISVHAPFLDWVIVGGESGQGARTFNLNWARSIRDQCAAAGVAFFLKQLGAVVHESAGHPADNHWPEFEHTKGGDWNEWPEDLRVRQFPA